MVVLLDWYAGHRTDEVEAVVTRKGHLLLFHGGGTTPWTQVNDTHCHALVRSELLGIENAVAVSQHKFNKRRGLLKVPTCSRKDILRNVTTMWQSLDHKEISRKGFQ